MKPIKHILNIIWKDITIFGSLVFYLFLILFTAAIQLYTLSLKLLVGLIISYIIIIFIRTIYYKDRPKKEKHTNYVEKIDSSSFPSMHATRAMMYLVLFSTNINKVSITILFSIIACLIIISRHLLKKHDTIDLLVGSILGITISVIIEFIL